MQKSKRTAPTQSTGVLCWVCKSPDEALRVVQKFKTVDDCKPLLAKSPERTQMLEQVFSTLPDQRMAYRIVPSADGRAVVHSADLMYVTDPATWNDICVFPSSPMYSVNRSDAPMIAKLVRIKGVEKSPERYTQSLCPLCLRAFDGNAAAREHMFRECLLVLANLTSGPIVF